MTIPEKEASNVIGIRGDAIVDPRMPNDYVIEKLQRLLEEAKAGEIVGFSIALSYHDKSTGSQWAGFVNYTTVGRLHGLIHDITHELQSS
jgi:hypothetical protein